MLQRRLLGRLPQERRSWVMNLVLRAVRDGRATKSDVVRAVFANLEMGAVRGDGRAEQVLEEIHVDTEALHDLAEWALWWESLPKEARERIKDLKAAKYLEENMRKHPPTEKQLRYLQWGLGVPVGELPKSRWEASRMIEELRYAGSQRA